jgi:hypothetical protein
MILRFRRWEIRIKVYADWTWILHKMQYSTVAYMYTRNKFRDLH